MNSLNYAHINTDYLNKNLIADDTNTQWSSPTLYINFNDYHLFYTKIVHCIKSLFGHNQQSYRNKNSKKWVKNNKPNHTNTFTYLTKKPFTYFTWSEIHCRSF